MNYGLLATQLVTRGSTVVMPKRSNYSTRSRRKPKNGARELTIKRESVVARSWKVAKLIRFCYPCQFLRWTPTPELIRSKPLPQCLWSKLAVHLLENPNKGRLLGEVGCCSKWPEISFLSKSNAETWPNVWIVNTFPPSTSQKFPEYLTINHKQGIPYWPQIVSEVERLDKTLLKAIRIAQLQGQVRNGKVRCKNFFPNTSALPIQSLHCLKLGFLQEGS